MLNAVTIAAIVAAVWAHPQGVAYIAKIDQIEAAAIACGNPCCRSGTQSGVRRLSLADVAAEERRLWQQQAQAERRFLELVSSIQPRVIMESGSSTDLHGTGPMSTKPLDVPVAGVKIDDGVVATLIALLLYD